MKKLLLILLTLLLLISSGCDFSPYINTNFITVNSGNGLYISKSNGAYINDKLYEVYGVIKNSSKYLKNHIKVKVILMDSKGSHLDTYTRTFGPIKPEKDIPLWLIVSPVNGIRPSGYQLEIVEAIEYHSIPSSYIGLIEGYHDYEFSIIDSSLTKRENSIYWEYTTKVNIKNKNKIDLDRIYCESLLYTTDGLITDYSNGYITEKLKSGKDTEINFSFLLPETKTVSHVNFWAIGYTQD